MKKCPFCTADIEDDAVKCDYCGSSLIAPTANETDVNYKVVMNENKIKRTKKRIKKTLWVMLFSFVLFVVSMIFGIIPIGLIALLAFVIEIFYILITLVKFWNIKRKTKKSINQNGEKEIYLLCFPSSIYESNVQAITGQNFDLNEIARNYLQNKSGAAKYLSEKANISAKDAKEYIFPVYEEYKKQLKTIINAERLEKIKAAKAIRVKAQEEAKRELAARLREYDRQGIAYCPRCYSTSLTANKKGFGIGKAVVGAAIAGPLGLVAGNIGSQKVKVTCLKCGYQFWAGKR